MTGLTNMLRNVRGEYEPIRVVGVAGGFVFIIGVQVFVGWNMAMGREFDIVAYCTAFPGGLSAIIATVAGSLKVKDKATEEARAVAGDNP